MVDMITFDSREEWLSQRKIGGSGASAILGRNPYMSNIEYYLLQLGEYKPKDISDNPVVKYGNDAEPLLRKLFALDHPQYRVSYTPNNMWVNDRFPFAHASLDGWITDSEGRMGVLEIKTTNIMKSRQKEKWDEQIPDNYYIQVLHYLMITEFDFAVLKAQLKWEFEGHEVYCQTKHYHIERDEVKEDLIELERAEREFALCLEEHRKPALILPEI